MASGNGTSGNPFVITTYEELTSIISNSMYAGEFHIAFDPNAENKLIDFNDVFYGEETTGISTAVGSKTTWYIHGNDWTILNMVISDNIIKSYEGIIYIENLHIKNFILMNSGSSSGVLFGRVNLSNCTLCGLTYGNSLSYLDFSYFAASDNNTSISKSVINVKHINNSVKFSLCQNSSSLSYFNDDYYVSFIDNNMEIHILRAYETSNTSRACDGLFAFCELKGNTIFVELIYPPDADYYNSYFNIGLGDTQIRLS